jgi:hypothetical protein
VLNGLTYLLYIAIIAHTVNRKRKKKRIFFQQVPGRSSAAAAANNQNNCTGYWRSARGEVELVPGTGRSFRLGPVARPRTIVLKPRSRTKSPGSTRPPGVVFQGRRGQDDPDSAPMSSPTPIKPRSRCPEQQPDDPEPEQFYWYRPGKPDGRRLLPPHGVFHGNIWVIRYLPLYLVGHAQ